MGTATDRSYASLDDGEETEFDTGLAYAQGRPARVHVRKRGRWYHLDDVGGAIALAGWSPGWMEAAERVAAEEGLNVTRRGRVFVSAIEGRDVEALIRKVAETSLALHDTLLELDGPG